MRNRLLLLLLLLTTLASLPSVAQPNTFSVLTYNCENAFDTIDTPGHRDADYLPQGSLHWTRARFHRKLTHIAQVLLAADTVRPLDMAILQEVETDSVLTTLVRRTPLASIGYDYVMTHSPDPRGINVAIVYSPYTFRPVAQQTIGLSAEFLANRRATPTRHILYLSGVAATGDTLHVYAVHLPSQLGGAEAAAKRAELLRLLAAHTDSVLNRQPGARILVAGDFNQGPSRRLLHRLPRLRCLMDGLKEGSYKYQGRWEWIDQVWVSPALAATTPRCLCPAPLLEPDKPYGGHKPFRTYIGPIYHGGYSDHLPVLVRLMLTK